ncbi:hypothetical protein HHI36_013710 [Cryptolaemus montrouzieri]|uniref:ABC transporter domain-containing protein n=1 Tax=Cryptolaemus montrouzieri TaxID=559131 RepID=A0ABD2NJ15_9CUCU
MSDERKLTLNDGASEYFSSRMSQSNEEYSYKISNEAMKAWKINFENESDNAPQIPTRNQKILSWCNINAFSKEKSVSGSVEVKPRLKSVMKWKKTEFHQKQILKNVNGIAYPGELLVIMGSSGAGKTTLLNCMTFRNLKDLEVSGMICLNNEPITQTDLAAQSAYIQQDDLFIGFLTVKEHLIFQSQMRMDSSFTKEQRHERIEEVMKELALKKCEHNMIGVPGIVKGISGGERKRLALASEMLTNPPLLFCDEPTTGLDSFMSLNVVQLLKDIARTGRTVIITLHQPSSELFHIFDKLCLMAEGRTAFLGTTAEAKDFFTELNVPCPRKFNPADHYIQLISVVPGREVLCKRAVNTICDAFSDSRWGVDIKKKTEKTLKSAKEKEDRWSHKRGHLNPYRVGAFTQAKGLFWRSWLTVMKNPATLKKFIIVLLESTMMTLIYFGQTLDQYGVQNLTGIFFYILMRTSYHNVFGILDAFCKEISLFMKEHKDGMYRTDIYFLSKVICEIPFPVVFACLNITLMYFFVGLNPEFDKFLMALLITALFSQCAQGFGFIVSAATPSVQLAIPIVGVTVTPLSLFGGMLLNFRSIPSYLRWASELSWFKGAYQAFMINQWADIDYIECHKNSSEATACLNNGIEVLHVHGIRANEFWPAIMSLISIFIAFRIVAFLILLFKASRKE